MPINLRPIAYGTGLTLSTDGALRIGPIRTKYDYEIVIQERKGKDANGNAVARWSIYASSASCLNRDGWWEIERQPSSRDEAYFARCRYASLDEARAWLEQVMEGQHA